MLHVFAALEKEGVNINAMRRDDLLGKVAERMNRRQAPSESNFKRALSRYNKQGKPE